MNKNKAIFLLFVVALLTVPVVAIAADFSGEWNVFIDAESIYEDGSENSASGNMKVILTKNEYGNLQGYVYNGGIAIGTAYLYTNSDKSAELALYITDPIILVSNYTMTISCKFFIKKYSEYMSGVIFGSFDENNVPIVLFHGKAYMYRPGGKG